MKKVKYAILGSILLVGIALVIYWVYPRSFSLPEQIDKIQFEYGDELYVLNSEETVAVVDEIKSWEIHKGKKSIVPYAGGITVQFLFNEEIQKEIYVTEVSKLYEENGMLPICYKTDEFIYDYFRKLADSM